MNPRMLGGWLIRDPLMNVRLSTGLALAFAALAPTKVLPAAAPARATSLSALPLVFEPNQGQAAGSTRFLARGENCEYLLAPTGVQFVLWHRDQTPPTDSLQQKKPLAGRELRARVARMEFVGANREPGMRGTEESAGKINYLLGNDPRRWRTGLASYRRVRAEQLYPGIDLVYYGNARRLEYDFELAPRTDPALIATRFDGVDALALSAEGELVLTLGRDQIRQPRPVLYQLVGGQRREVSGGYELRDQRTVGFRVGRYDRDLPLVIDPTFAYATYFGGNGGEAAYAVKVDDTGAVYITGATLSPSFLFSISTNSFQTNFNGGTLTGDAFVAKLDHTGTNLVYFTYLGGNKEDAAYGLALDSAGNVFLAGTTDSPDFPTRNPLFATIAGSPDPTIGVFPNDVFVAELNGDGSALVYSTYLGGAGNDIGSGVAVDPAGNTYVTGFTDSTNFPTLNACQSTNGGGDDAFVAKLGPGGTNLVYSTFLGGHTGDHGQSVAADGEGFAYVTGYTFSTNFPYLNGFQTTNYGSADVFVTVLNPTGALVYSTYFGGSFSDFATHIVLDPARNLLIAGTTQSTNFPQTGSILNLGAGNNGTNAFNYDAFVAEIDTNGNLAKSVRFGGRGDDAIWGLAVDGAGRVFVAGTTLSFDFPVTNVFGLFHTNSFTGKDVFVTALDANLTSALYSGYLGGFLDDLAYGIAVDSESSAYVAGMTGSTNFPTASPYQASLLGPNNAFVAKIRLLDPTLTASLTGGNLTLRWSGAFPDVLLQSTLSLSPPSSWTTVPQAPVLSQGFYSVTVGVTNPFSAFRLAK